MITLYQYIDTHIKKQITEGGMTGHMAHVIDYDEMTCTDLCDLVDRLFTGEIEDITEKVDGTNIQATMNNLGEVVFIRNKSDLNSSRGGMTIDDMARKWADKPSVSKTFVESGKIITKVFEKIGKRFFNPNKLTRRVVNCECVIEGTTNVIPYGEAQVDFHDVWTYVFEDDVWVVKDVSKVGLDKIERACEDILGAQITPQLIVKTTLESEKIRNQYKKDINKLFSSPYQTIKDWKKERFNAWIEDNYQELQTYPDILNILFERWFENNKSTNIRELRKQYSEFADQLNDLDKNRAQDIVRQVCSPLDNLFSKIGNSVINICDGFINKNNKITVITSLQNELKKTIKELRLSEDPKVQSKLLRELDRLQELGGESSINHVEGIVFRYKNKLMKLTGSFAPLNQIIGMKKFNPLSPHGHAPYQIHNRGC